MSRYKKYMAEYVVEEEEVEVEVEVRVRVDVADDVDDVA